MDELHRVVLGRRHLLERCSVHHRVDAVQCAEQAIAIAHVADEVAQRRVALDGKLLRHLELLEFVAAENDQSLDLGIARQDVFDEGLAKTAGASSDENALVIKHVPLPWVKLIDCVPRPRVGARALRRLCRVRRRRRRSIGGAR